MTEKKLENATWFLDTHTHTHMHIHMYLGVEGSMWCPIVKPSVWLSPAPQAKPVTGQAYRHILEPTLKYPYTF